MFYNCVIAVLLSLQKPDTTVDEYSVKARQVQFEQNLCQTVTTVVPKKHFQTSVIA